MNQHDRKQLEIAHLKLDDMRQDLVDLKKDMEKAHQKTDENLSFIKENLFNPHQGLWAETKLNSQFRDDSKKWRLPIGVGFIGLVIKNIWESMTS
jgi:t-SNARE complex subunit (syntaxin)|tara:strand:- start:519 stop:803 length:285 start_codon:yes stop_codon:yes gene_type:complete